MGAQRKETFEQRQARYAISEAKIVTIHEGKRLVKVYRSGEKLQGRVIERYDYML